MARGGTFIRDGIGPVVGVMAATLVSRVADAVYDGAQELEDYARSNAVWADRTGDARAGLTADVSVEGTDIVLTLAHTVEYGEWLEVIQDGRFAIIMPTLEALGPEIINRASGRVVPGGEL